MKKWLLLSVGFMFLLSCGSKQSVKTADVTEWNENDLKGTVKVVKTYLYYSDGELGSSYVEQFDENNRLIEKTEYDGGTIIDRHTTYSYNNNGNLSLKKSINYRYSEDGDTSDFIYTYNDNGLNTGITEIYTSNPFDVIENEYDDKGLLVRSISYGDESTEIHYAYDENGKLARTQRLYDHAIYEYDQDGKLISRKVYQNGDDEAGDHMLLLTESYEYDDNGRLIKEYARDADGPSTLDYDKVMRYDDKNRLVELKITDSEGRIERHITYTYDEKDDMVELIKLLDHAFSRETSTYTYDKEGNWIEAHHNFDSTEAKVIREIEYYK